MRLGWREIFGNYLNVEGVWKDIASPEGFLTPLRGTSREELLGPLRAWRVKAANELVAERADAAEGSGDATHTANLRRLSPRRMIAAARFAYMACGIRSAHT